MMMIKQWWPSMTWFGADPGGTDNFGVAALREDGTYDTHCVNCADEAITWLRRFGRPNGVGIDCPLWWSSGRGGGRKADQWLRDQGISSGTVQSANSLQGAVLVQGVMFAVRLRERYQGVLITEAHPKALLRFLGLSRDLDKWDEVQKGFNLKGSAPSEHERDAVLAAVAAREGMTGVWSRDLSIDRCASEVDPKRMWLGEVSYFWPYKAVARGVRYHRGRSTDLDAARTIETPSAGNLRTASAISAQAAAIAAAAKLRAADDERRQAKRTSLADKLMVEAKG